MRPIFWEYGRFFTFPSNVEVPQKNLRLYCQSPAKKDISGTIARSGQKDVPGEQFKKARREALEEGSGWHKKRSTVEDAP